MQHIISNSELRSKTNLLLYACNICVYIHISHREMQRLWISCCNNIVLLKFFYSLGFFLEQKLSKFHPQKGKKWINLILFIKYFQHHGDWLAHCACINILYPTSYCFNPLYTKAFHWVNYPPINQSNARLWHKAELTVWCVSVTSSQTLYANLNHWSAAEKMVLCKFKSEAKQSRLIDDQHSLTLMRPCCPRPGPVQYTGLTPDCSCFLWSCLLFPLLGLSLLVLITSPPNGTDER